MAKPKINKNEKRRLWEKQQYAQATQVRLLAEGLQSQQQLDTVLLQESDLTRRRAMFNFMKPFLKFKDPSCPSPLDAPRIIRP